MVFLKGHNFNIGSLIHVGSKFVSNASISNYISVSIDSDGYDGQFFYRLALDPFYKDISIGPRLDAPAYRQQRILYPLIVWLFSLGNKNIVPFTMVIINLIFLCCLSWFGADYAVKMGRSPLWGFFLSLYPGFLFSFLHDLPEAIAATFLLVCFIAIRTSKTKLGCTALILGILTRETLVLTAITIVIVWFWHIYKEKSADGSNLKEGLFWYSGIIPLVVFALWQMIVFFRWGYPSFVEGCGNIGAPLLGIATTIWKTVGIFDILLLIGFLLIGVLAVVELKSQDNLLHEKVAFVFYALFALLFTSVIWEYRGGFLRALSEYYLLGFLIMVPSKRLLSKFLFWYWILLFLGSAIGYLL